MLPAVAVLRVVKVLPQVQVTWVSTYVGWISVFTGGPLLVGGPGSHHGAGTGTCSVCQNNTGWPDRVPLSRAQPRSADEAVDASSGDDAAGSDDVVGVSVRRTRRAMPSVWWVVAAVGTLVVVAFVFGGEGVNRPPVAARITLAPISTPSTTFGTLSNIAPIGQPQISSRAPSPTPLPEPTFPLPLVSGAPSGPSSGAPSGPSTPARSVGPIFANDAGLGLFLYNVSGVATANVRVNLATGDIEALPADADRYNFVGLSGAGADAHMVTRADLGGDQASPCPDGSWWVARYGAEGQLDSLQRVQPRAGNTPATLQAVVVDRQVRCRESGLGIQ